jgi:hypothetical protein
MLVTLRICLADGTRHLLAAEVDEPPATPERFLQQFVRDGQIAVGDRASVSASDVVQVEFAAPEPQSAPPWREVLADEDVESAMEGRFETPPYEPE